MGVTTNPSIFQKAPSARATATRSSSPTSPPAGSTVDEAVRMITTADVRDAADILRPVLRRHRRPGRPGVHRGRPAAGARHRGHRRRGQAARLAGRPAQRADQDPGDRGGPARRSPRSSAAGISVNVTLIFSLERYREVMDAYLTGLEQAKARRPATCPTIHSVASFFVSRVDTEIDKRLDDDRHRRGHGAARQGRASPTRGSPTRRTRRSSAGERWAALDDAPAPTSSVRCGPRPA